MKAVNLGKGLLADWQRQIIDIHEFIDLIGLVTSLPQVQK